MSSDPIQSFMRGYYREDPLTLDELEYIGQIRPSPFFDDLDEEEDAERQET